MASFDPSIISQIPDFAPNPANAQAKAFKLADIMDEQKLHRLQLGQAQRDEANIGKITSLLGKSKLDTPEDRLRVGSEIMKIDPAKGMEFMRSTSQEALTELETKRIQLEFQANEVGLAATGLKDTLLTKGLPAMAAEYQQQVPQINERLVQMGSKPLPLQFPTNDPQQAQKILEAQIGHSEKAAQALQRKEQTKNIESEISHRGETEKIEKERLDIERQKLALAQKRAEGGLLDPDDLKFGAKQYLAGDKSVFQNMGRGAQGAQNIVAMRHAIREEAEAQGLQPRDVATKIAEFNGLMSEERSLGVRQAAIETAATEAQKVIPIALKASRDVPRGSFVPLNKLIQKGQIMTSNVPLAKFAQANLTLANVYARAMSPTGVPAVSAREHALEILGTAPSQEAYEGVLSIITQEIEAARTSPAQVRKDIRSSIGGETYKAPAPGPAAGANTVNWADLK